MCKPYKNPLKVLEYDYLKNICQHTQFLSSYSRKRDRTERMEQWYGNLPSAPTGLFIADLLLPCVKKKKKFKPLSQPQSLKFLALFLSIESRGKKKNQTFFFLSQAYQSQDLFHHYGNVFEINNKGWFLQGLKKLYYLKLLNTTYYLALIFK